jgi:hypothetical protein
VTEEQNPRNSLAEGPTSKDSTLPQTNPGGVSKDGSEGPGPDRLEKTLGKWRSERGRSNTPSTQPLFNTCIDYFKMRFDASYEDRPSFFEKLLKVLLVDPSFFHEGPGINGYMKKLDMGVGLSLWYGGTITKNNLGQSTTVLEMKGSACRDYEEHVFSDAQYKDEFAKREDVLRQAWIELIDACLDLGGHCTRIDLPTDDMSGTLTSDEIKDKITKREYTTFIRRLDVTDASDIPLEEGGNVEGDLVGIATTKMSKLSGYSATFGGRDTTQLCIYDKKAEQQMKGNFVSCKSWIRFEVRYYHKNAERELPRLYEALLASNESSHIAGALAATIQFKEPNEKDENHRHEAKGWGKWSAFLAGVQANEPFAALEPTLSIGTNAAWLVKEAAKVMVRIVSATGCSVDQLFKILVVEGVNRLDNKDLQAINQFRRAADKEPYRNLDDVQRAVLSLPMMGIDVPKKLMQLFYGHKS